MWEERTANPGETVKITWSAWMNKRPTIGIFLRSSGGRAVIDLGGRLVWLEGNSFEVWNPKFC